MKSSPGRTWWHTIPQRTVEEVAPAEVRVIERWVTDERKAQDAREHIQSLVRHLAMRKLLGKIHKRNRPGHE